MRSLKISLFFTVCLLGSVNCALAEATVADGLPPEPTKLERTISLLKDSQSAKNTQHGIGNTVDGASDENTGAGLRMAEGLAFCLGLLMLGVYALKKGKLKGIVHGSKAIRVIERSAVTQRTSLLLVEVQGRKVLLSVGSDRVSFHSMSDSDSDLEFDDSLENVCRVERKMSA